MIQPGESLPSGAWVDASSCDLEMTPLPAEAVIEGSPATGSWVFWEDEKIECGVWEMSPGVARDVEVDEMFVVLHGEALLTREIAGKHVELTLRPGVMVSLREGERTTWAVTSPLRKVYWVRKPL